MRGWSVTLCYLFILLFLRNGSTLQLLKRNVCILDGKRQNAPVYLTFQEIDATSKLVTAEILVNGENHSYITTHSSAGGCDVGRQGLQGLRAVGRLFRSLLLPDGFPSTVPPEYATFQAWNVLQDFCSYLRGVMATGAVLEGMGVGRAEATALQATIQWIYRDGASMLGGLLFTSLSSHDFGQNVKQWRLFADAINNVGITLDMIAPYFRRQFLLLVCCGSVCKALCGIAAGATGAAIAEHWGEQHGNIADVLAKNNAQHTLVSVLGLLFTVKFATFAATASPLQRWSTYLSLTAMHMGANYLAMRVLALRTINRARYDFLLNTLFSCPHWQHFSASDEELAVRINSWLQQHTNDFSLASVAARESILTRKQDVALEKVKLWANPNVVFSQFNTSVITDAVIASSEMDYLILADSATTQVCFGANATATTELQAAMEASLFKHIGGVSANTVTRARRLTKQVFPEFLEVLRKQGWKVSLPKLRPRGARAFRLLP